MHILAISFHSRLTFQTNASRHEEGRDKPPAPMLSFGAKPGTASILIPDHTHWGNEGPLLAKVSNGMGIQGWDRQHEYLKVTCTTRLRHSSLRAMCSPPAFASPP